MNISIDYYIQDYFENHFECPQEVFLPRDFEFENQLYQLGKAELILKTNPFACLDLFKFEDLSRFEDLGIYIDEDGFSHSLRKDELTCFNNTLYGIPQNLFSFDILNAYIDYNKCDPPWDWIERWCSKNKLNRGHFIRCKDSISEACKIFFTGDTGVFYNNRSKILISTLAIKREGYKPLFDTPFEPFDSILLPVPKEEKQKQHCFELPKVKNVTRVTENSIVILTDSFELAVRNQKKLVASGNKKIFWLYWSGSISYLREIAFTLLRGVRVYYLMVEHSGYNRKQIIEKAEIIESKFLRYGVKDYRFVSLLSTHPTLLGTLKNLNNTGTKKILSLEQFQKEKGLELEKKTSFITPFIPAQAFTIIYGRNFGLNSRFAMRLALSASVEIKEIELEYFINKEQIAIKEYLQKLRLSYESIEKKKFPQEYAFQKNILFPNRIGIMSRGNLNNLDELKNQTCSIPRLLVIDGFGEKNNIDWIALQSDIRNLIAYGWTVILVLETSKQLNSTQLKKISAQNYLQLEQIKFSNACQRFKLSIDSFWSRPGKGNAFKYEFDFNYDPYIFRQLPTTIEEQQEIQNTISQMRLKKTPWETIAKVLNLTTSKARYIHKKTL